MGPWTQKVNSARHRTDSSYLPHLPPLNFTGNGVSSPLDAKHMKENICSHFPEQVVYLGLPY